MIKIKVRWFKQSGKYYSEGETRYDVNHFYEAVDQFELDLKNGIRPGLVDDINNEFYAVLKIYTEHGPLPFLIVSKKNEHQS